MKLINKLFGFLFILLLTSCSSKRSLFHLVSSDHSGIHFNNHIVENDSINPIDVTNVYNGGGVGMGDFNNDGLEDVYFTGNLVSNKLYLNKGKFKFEDITKQAGVEGEGRWCRGVSVVDINNDGWLDMYVSATLLHKPEERENLLYINQGADKNGVPHFKELGAEYGLNDTTHSTMAAFFDYDNDGDLDMYLVVNQIVKGDNPAVYRPKLTKGEHPSTGRLYRNDWNASLKHPLFTNVTKEAGVTIEGFGHGVNIADFNKDGWKDIFVTNDFNSNDLLYINNHDGTFTDKASEYFKHTSANGMGQDVIDINNDGLSDVVELDMDPEDNYRKKMMMNANSYQNYQNSEYYKYQYQYVRNSLQLNQGPRVTQNDSIGDPVFSDVGFFSGIAETDWSWTPLVSDFDNDGFRDIIISNGFPKDITDHDFVNFRSHSFNVASKDFTLSQIPQVKLHNYAFHNKGDVTFDNVTTTWGLTTPSFSNGAAYADLDNDGDMDMIVNNINDEAFVYENTLMNKNDSNQHFLSINLVGDSLNRNGLGTWIEVYYGGKQQAYEQSPYRGYLSSIDIRPHFGLGNVSKVDSVVIKWPGNKEQVLRNVAANQTLTVNIKSATKEYNWNRPLFAPNTLFTEITDSLGIHYQHQQKDFVDFNIQKLLPHKFSEYSPALAVGDVDGNGLDDIIAGGAISNSPVALLQKKDGSFLQKNILSNADYSLKQGDDRGVTLFDADGDGDLDMYVASGGYEMNPNSNRYHDVLYVNNGIGDFSIDTAALPKNLTSKSCVRVADYDNDGDLDLFVAGRVEPGHYPKPVSSFIYRNDTKNGIIKFTDVSASAANPLNNIGLVCDAVWTDFNNDGWPDLVLAGEWMPITFIKNNKGSFENITPATNVANKKGWWTSIVPGDFDNDGDVDFIAGNLGLNSFFKATDQYPASIYAKDFDKNGSYDAIPTLYLPSSQQDTTRREYPVHTRDDMTKQLIFFKSKFQNYKSYATTPFSKMFTAEEMKGALKLQANYFSNSYIRNDGNGKFTITPLPLNTQYSCMNGMISEDFDQDGNLDVLMVGNDYGTDVSVGRYDACNGLMLRGDGKGGFSSLSIVQSGWFVPGDAKALVKLRSTNGKCLLAASQNKSKMKVFELKKDVSYIPLEPLDVKAIITYKNGKKQKRELYYGSSFLSQSGRFINIDKNISSVDITDSKGKRRLISF
ncbi:VCBS repeat-containing protein [Segetibacter koreensis]|uniref:VCBS repeat-containing protein n=1 Tax=Segetibacter koreensis TaxID=398037 RepID=UPI000380F9D2|nr:VCBS repeat-containing protein [Segetibacter koreensis]